MNITISYDVANTGGQTGHGSTVEQRPPRKTNCLPTSCLGSKTLASYSAPSQYGSCWEFLLCPVFTRTTLGLRCLFTAVGHVGTQPITRFMRRGSGVAQGLLLLLPQGFLWTCGFQSLHHTTG